MNNTLVDFYRCPETILDHSSPNPWHPLSTDLHGGPLAKLLEPIISEDPLRGSEWDFATIVENLRLERYNTKLSTVTGALLASEAARRLYYRIRAALPDFVRQSLQRAFLRDWKQLPFPQWPVDTSVEELFERHLLMTMTREKLKSVPFIWFWPDGAPSAAIVTHDVEASAGLACVPGLIDVDDDFGIKTSFQLVPEQRYTISNDTLEIIRKGQCEVNVHGLNHNGNLFGDRSTFSRHCKRINYYVREFGAEGFRSPCMYRNAAWFEELNISYDMSVPNVAHLEPQRGGCCTIFPYFIGDILELPLTTVQDYSLFHIMDDYSIELWKRQIDVIVGRHGLLSFIIHPDYIFAEKSLPVYRALLAYLSRLRAEWNLWIARPGDVNRWWRERSAMKLIFDDGVWRIAGRGQERARIALACIEGDRLIYKVEQSAEPLHRNLTDFPVPSAPIWSQIAWQIRSEL